LPFGWQVPATHELPEAHCASLVHVLVVTAQTEPAHPAAPQASCTGAGHDPEPLHMAASVITPAEHVPARHSVDAPG
jgi:hypothetical protein